MDQAGKDKRINGTALEMIMQDVLNGMQNFTHETCAGCSYAVIDVIAVERPENQPASAAIIPFRKPGNNRD